MTLSPAWLDELRARTVLSAVIAPSVKLLRAGREWKACCPFHNEKTPSFTVNDDKGFYHCFGCGAHGDAIRFLTDHRGMPFMDAVKELAGKAGLEVPAPDPKAKERAERTASLTDVMADVAKWYADQLNGIAGQEARDYLKRRGIGADTIQRFGLGLAPDSRSALKRALETLGEDRLVETGMLIRPDDGTTYDRFRGRLMFPIRDPRGRVIAFGGRILGEGEPKYLNSPDTELFDKGRTLYNLDRAGPASRTAKRLIVVEGYMDVIALDQAGIAEAVAPNGTALTEAQMERLWRLEPAPILCFDGDSAGRKAAIRAAMRALPLLGPERTLRFVELPAGQDPDDVIRTAGRDAFEALLAQAEPLVDRLWRHEHEAEPLATPEAWAGLKQRLVAHASAIGHPDLARLYRQDWLDRFYALRRPPERERRPFAKDGRWAPPEPPVGQSAKTVRAFGSDQTKMVEQIFIGLVRNPTFLADSVENLSQLHVEDDRLNTLRDWLIDYTHAGEPLESEAVLTRLRASGFSALVSHLLDAGRSGCSFARKDADPERAREDLAAAFEIIAASDEVEEAMGNATERLERDCTDEAWQEQQRLIAAQQGLRQRLASLAGTD